MRTAAGSLADAAFLFLKCSLLRGLGLLILLALVFTLFKTTVWQWFWGSDFEKQRAELAETRLFGRVTRFTILDFLSLNSVDLAYPTIIFPIAPFI